MRLSPRRIRSRFSPRAACPAGIGWAIAPARQARRRRSPIWLRRSGRVGSWSAGSRAGFFSPTPLDPLAEGPPHPRQADRLSNDRRLAPVNRRLETWRRIELVLTAALVVVGYATVNLVMRLAVIPLLLVLGNTYLIKYMQEALENDALAG